MSANDESGFNQASIAEQRRAAQSGEAGQQQIAPEGGALEGGGYKPPPITGYRNLSQMEVDAVNRVKAIGAELERMIEQASVLPTGCDQRWLAIGKTHLQQGLMAVARAITRPTSF